MCAASVSAALEEVSSEKRLMSKLVVTYDVTMEQKPTRTEMDVVGK